MPKCGSVIREVRRKKGLTQEALANFIGVSVRAIGEWERDEITPTQEHTLALMECLGVEPDLLGARQHYDFSPQEARACNERTRSYLDEAMFTSAYMGSSFRVRNLERQVQEGDEALLELLIETLNLAGHSASIARDDAMQAFGFYQRMEQYVRQLPGDDAKRQTLVSHARTYQGEMLRRRGDTEGALQAFQEAPQTPEVNVSVRGNRAQLLARAYTDIGDFEMAKRQLDRSLDLIDKVSSDTNGIYVCYNLCGTYIEYFRYNWYKNNMKECSRYMELAEKAVSEQCANAPRWQIPVLINQGKLLMSKAPRSGPGVGFSMGAEFQEGMRLLEAAIKVATKAGHRRQLSQIDKIKHTLYRQGKEYMDAGHRLNEGLDGLDRRDSID